MATIANIGWRTLLAIVVPVTVACATTGGMADRNNDVIERDELLTAQVSDLYQAVERLRPLWLRSRGIRSFTQTTEIAVVRDGAYFGPLETLRTIPADQAFRLEYMDGATVASRVAGVVGMNRAVEAAIVVTLSQVPPPSR